MIIFIFLYSAERLSLLSSPTRAAMTHSRVNGENPSVLSVLCGRQMLPCNCCIRTGTNGCKWEQMAVGLPWIPLCWRWEKKKGLTIWSMRLEKTSFRNNWIFLKKITDQEAALILSEKLRFEVVSCSVLGLLVGSILQQQPCRSFPVLVIGCVCLSELRRSWCVRV